MSLSIDFWGLVGFAITIIGAFFALAKMFISANYAKLNEQFKRVHDRLDKHHEDQVKSANQLQILEKQLSEHRLEVSEKYVRRDDFIRVQGVLEAKIDNLSLRMREIVSEAIHSYKGK